MFDSSIALLGTFCGCLVGLVGGYCAAMAAYRSAETGEQRRFLRQLFMLGGLYALFDMVLILLASIRVVHTAFLLIGFLLWFVPLGPVMARVHRRLGDLAVPAS
jgi:hypothetical protein